MVRIALPHAENLVLLTELEIEGCRILKDKPGAKGDNFGIFVVPSPLRHRNTDIKPAFIRLQLTEALIFETEFS